MLLQTVERPLHYTVAHYDIWNAMCGKNLLECFYDWIRSLISDFLDVKPPWVIVNHDDVFFSRKSYRSVAALSQGRAGKDEGISGSLGVGCSLAHVWHQMINSLICVESPGHHTEVRALDLHLVRPRWLVWMQSRICSRILLGINIRSSYRSRSSTIARWLLFSQYGGSNGWWGMQGGNPWRQYDLKGSILRLSSVHLLSAVVGLVWQGDRKLSELLSTSVSAVTWCFAGTHWTR